MNHRPRRTRNAMDERQRMITDMMDRQDADRNARAAEANAANNDCARADADAAAARARADAAAAAAAAARARAAAATARARAAAATDARTSAPATAPVYSRAAVPIYEAQMRRAAPPSQPQQTPAPYQPTTTGYQPTSTVRASNPFRPHNSLRDTLRDLDRSIYHERRVRNPAERDSKDVPNDPTARALHRFQAAMGRGGFDAAIRASHARLGRMLEIEKLLGFKYAMRQLQRDYAHAPHARAALQELIERADAEIDNLENKPRPRRR